MPKRIAAIARLDELERLGETFARQAGYEPELLSHWDAKQEIQREVETWLASAPRDASRVAYAFSSYLELEDRDLRERLLEEGDRGLVLTATGTTAIATVLMHLKNSGVDHLSVVTPAYFAVEALCQSLGLAVSFASIVRHAAQYRLPQEVELGPRSAVWLTMPVFGTSCYVDPAGIAGFIDALPTSVAVVMDEGLAFPDRPSLRRTRTMDRVIRIVTPNKAICINGEKVSFISAPRSAVDTLNDWSECVSGGIGASGMNALHFFRSAAFPATLGYARRVQAELRARMISVLHGLSAYQLDEGTDGHFVMIYWPKLPMSLLEHHESVLGLMAETGASAIPASRNKHPERYGLCFRVNLMRLDNAGLGALRRFAVALEAASASAS